MKSTISIRFMDRDGIDNGNELRIVQNFNGLNVWDQLAVDIEVNGNLPDVPPSASIIFPDASDTYILSGENEIRSEGNGHILVNQQNISFVFTQTVIFSVDIAKYVKSINQSHLFSKD